MTVAVGVNVVQIYTPSPHPKNPHNLIGETWRSPPLKIAFNQIISFGGYWVELYILGHVRSVSTITRNVLESWKANAVVICCKCSLGYLRMCFSFFQDLEVQLEAVNCPWITAGVEYTLHIVFSLWCLCLCSSWGFPVLQKFEGVEIENQSSALRLLRVGRSCKWISLVTLTWAHDDSETESIHRSQCSLGSGSPAVDQLRCGYLLPQRSWMCLGHETETTHEESPPKK